MAVCQFHVRLRCTVFWIRRFINYHLKIQHSLIIHAPKRIQYLEHRPPDKFSTLKLRIAFPSFPGCSDTLAKDRIHRHLTGLKTEKRQTKKRNFRFNKPYPVVTPPTATHTNLIITPSTVIATRFTVSLTFDFHSDKFTLIRRQKEEEIPYKCRWVDTHPERTIIFNW